MSNLEALIRELDIMITGKQPTGSPAPFDREEWLFFNELFYCSDGGYSRLFFSLDTGHVCLDSVSTDHAKNRWSDADVLAKRSEIDTIAREMVLTEDPEYVFNG